jgi:hypothetical protein
MLTDSFTVFYRCVSMFLSLTVVSEDGKGVQVFPYPSMLYGRRDGRITVRMRNGHKSVTLPRNYTRFYGLTETGLSQALHIDFSTQQGLESWYLSNPDVFGMDRIRAIKALREASVAATGAPVGLKAAKEATETPAVRSAPGNRWLYSY